jgi:diacylglycerol kinase (ATP)
MARRTIHLIVNPVAGRGRALQVLDKTRGALDGSGHVIESVSAHSGNECAIAEAAARGGAAAIVVIGGDGSFSHAVRGVVQSGVRVPIAIIAAGTGNDFAKSLGAPVHDIEATAALIATDSTRDVDVGTAGNHTFVNSAGFGFDVEVLTHIATHGGGSSPSRYAVTAMRQLFNYRGFTGSMRSGPYASNVVGGASGTSDDHWLTIVFANGRWFGGLFEIAPDARIDDGLIDCIGIRDAGALRRVSLFARAMRGLHTKSGAVYADRQPEFVLQFPAPPRFQVDGELVQASSATVRIGVKRRAISVFAET